MLKEPLSLIVLCSPLQSESKRVCGRGNRGSTEQVSRSEAGTFHELSLHLHPGSGKTLDLKTSFLGEGH